MELTPDQIKENWDKLLSFITTYISEPRRQKLLDFYAKYEDRLILMPASHRPQYHNCFPGGYVDHVNRVISAALETQKIWESLGTVKNWTDEELVFSALNHDLGKMGNKDHEAYIEQTDSWKRDKLGEIYAFNTKLSFMSVPDRSLFLLTQAGIPYSENEYLSIKLHDGVYDEANKPYLMAYLPESRPRTSLVFIIHQVDMIAARIEFETEWYPKFQGEKSKPVSTKVTKKERTDNELKKMSTPALNKSITNMLATLTL